MSTTTNFKDLIDLPMWRPESPAIGATAAGSSIAWDHRNNNTSHPFFYYLRSATNFEALNPLTGDWMILGSPALTGTFGAGAFAVFHPSQGPRGTIAAGATTTSITLTTVLPAAVGVNQLANRGDGVGFRIRIITNTAGAAGKIEERTIVANTGGTTPTIYLDSALGSVPASGAGYEIISGRVFLLSSGIMAAGCWKYYDIATNSFSGNLSITTLPATLSMDTNGLALSECHVPNDAIPGEGFIPGGDTYDGAKKCILATASSSTSITGSGMFADLQANEYSNFQIRIVEDTTTPTAVGQRRRITSHTLGATGVFTVPTWTVTPSESCKFVIENDDDKILLRTTAAVGVYTYNITANTWDATTFANMTACGLGVIFEQAFGITRNIAMNARHSNIFCFRGGATTGLDLLDIAGAATGTVTNTNVYGNLAQTFTTGTTGAYDPVTLGGRYLHININGTQRMARFDMKNRVLEPSTYMRYPQGVALVGQKLAHIVFIDGSTKINMLYQLTHTQTHAFSLLVQR